MDAVQQDDVEVVYEVPVVPSHAAVEEPAGPPGDPDPDSTDAEDPVVADLDPAVWPMFSMHVEAFGPTGERVLTVAQVAEDGSRMDAALQAMREAGYFDSSGPVLDLAGVLLIVLGLVEAFEAKHGPAMEVLDYRLRACLRGEPMMTTELLEQHLAARRQIGPLGGRVYGAAVPLVSAEDAT